MLRTALFACIAALLALSAGVLVGLLTDPIPPTPSSATPASFPAPALAAPAAASSLPPASSSGLVPAPASTTRPAPGPQDEPRPMLVPLPRLDRWTFAVTDTSPTSDLEQGVGTVLAVRFAEPIPRAARWKVQDSLTITSTDPAQDLSARWAWTDESTLVYRPQRFWRPQQTLTITSTWPIGRPLALIPKRTSKHPVAYEDLVEIVIPDEVSFVVRIGTDQRFLIDADTHQGRFVRAGRALRTIPVSLGRPGWESASGIKTVMERYDVKRLYNPGQWDVTVPWALRLTLSGEFIHSAPWNGSIGQANTSHGCTNMTTEDAHWFYLHAQRGDPVITVHGGDLPEPWDGDGAVWNLSWHQWQQMAARVP